MLDNFATQAAGLLAERLVRDIERRGRVSVALAGGQTPLAVYEAMAQPSIRERVDFSKVEFYQGDERPVGPADPLSNWGAACRMLLDPAGVPEENRHRMLGESPDLEAAASSYEQLLRARLSQGEITPVFDLLLLGIGQDGHTASIFPGTAAMREERRLVLANYVPQLNGSRLTMTWPVINAARSVWIMIAGASKREIVTRAVAHRDPSLPVSLVRPITGRCRWLLDRAAAAGLEPTTSGD